jgi:transglutaminase-like putative cysteine protease
MQGAAAASAMRFALVHRTSYRFDRAVGLAPHEIRLRPAPHAQLRIDAYALDVEPASRTLHWQQDPFANWVARLTFPDRASLLELRVELSGELVDVNPFNFFVDPAAAGFPFAYAPMVRHALAPYLDGSLACNETADRRDDLLAGWVDAFRATITPGEETIGLLVRLNRQLRGDVDYVVREAQGVQGAAQTLALRSGSCRDSAWLLILILRRLGIAARFVSGYLLEFAADGDERDVGSLHAWAEAFVPGAGWIGLDPTSGLLAAGGHIPLACAADPDMAATVTGTTDVCTVTFDTAIDVRRIGRASPSLR